MYNTKEFWIKKKNFCYVNLIQFYVATSLCALLEGFVLLSLQAWNVKNKEHLGTVWKIKLNFDYKLIF
jgi:hypothetical protein